MEALSEDDAPEPDPHNTPSGLVFVDQSVCVGSQVDESL